MSAQKQQKARDKELAQMKGIEGWFKRNYPELYAELKAEAEESGIPLTELIVRYVYWYREIKKGETFITKDDLKNVTPDSLLAAVKFFNYTLSQYIKIISYVNISQALTLLNYMLQLRGYPTTEVKTGGLLPTITLPEEKSKLDRVITSIIKGLETFTMGARKETLKEIAKESAREVVRELLRASESEGGEVKNEAQS